MISSFNTPAYLKQERNQFMTLDDRIEGNRTSFFFFANKQNHGVRICTISQLDSNT